MQIETLRQQLNTYRLFRDLTFEELRAEMRQQGIELSLQTLWNFMAGKRRPMHRTAIKLRTFLDVVCADYRVRRGMARTARLQLEEDHTVRGRTAARTVAP